MCFELFCPYVSCMSTHMQFRCLQCNVNRRGSKTKGITYKGCVRTCDRSCIYLYTNVIERKTNPDVGAKQPRLTPELARPAVNRELR